MKVKDQLKICTRYITKQKNAVESGVLFALPLVSFINIMKAKRCSITGHSIQNSGGHWAWNYTTIDRVDRSRGYEKGNCIAVAQRVNEIKGLVEDPNNSLTPDDLIKIGNYMKESANK
jgi:hypothetical protein